MAWGGDWLEKTSGTEAIAFGAKPPEVCDVSSVWNLAGACKGICRCGLHFGSGLMQVVHQELALVDEHPGRVTPTPRVLPALGIVACQLELGLQCGVAAIIRKTASRVFTIGTAGVRMGQTARCQRPSGYRHAAVPGPGPQGGGRPQPRGDTLICSEVPTNAWQCWIRDERRWR
jgi:hypothetical protein